jgi:hypothetical protein
MGEWRTFTPDGRPLVVWARENDVWIVRCSGSADTRSPRLEVALMEAIRGGRDLISRSLPVNYGERARTRAERIQAEFLEGHPGG